MEPSQAAARKKLDAYLAPDNRTTRRVGSGIDGLVYFTDRGSVVKIHVAQRKFETELACYQRLRAQQVHAIEGLQVPRLIAYDRERWIIEMSVVSPPCVLDFAQCELDRDPSADWGREIVEDYIAKIHEEFGDRAQIAFDVHAYLWRRCRIYHRDINPRNLQLPDHGQ